VTNQTPFKQNENVWAEVNEIPCLGISTKICRHSPVLIKIGQQLRALCMNTYLSAEMARCTFPVHIGYCG
jgi:hypothetical protein